MKKTKAKLPKPTMISEQPQIFTVPSSALQQSMRARDYIPDTITESSAFREAHFDEKTQSIVITFHNGYRYRYGMDRVWGKFQHAVSAGEFFQKHLRPLPCERLEDAPKQEDEGANSNQ